jgi:hypothetical protein
MLNANFATRIQKHRVALQETGLRPVRILLIDKRRAGFAEECRRQSLLLKNDTHEKETTEWLESVADCDGWQ